MGGAALAPSPLACGRPLAPPERIALPKAGASFKPPVDRHDLLRYNRAQEESKR